MSYPMKRRRRAAAVKLEAIGPARIVRTVVLDAGPRRELKVTTWASSGGVERIVIEGAALREHGSAPDGHIVLAPGMVAALRNALAEAVAP